MAKSKLEMQPVSNVEWVHRDDLHANDYNPNIVAPPEHDLLEISLLMDGWTQPIVKRWDDVNKRWEIVDGFNRWLMSGRPRVYAMTDGFVPTVVIKPGSRYEQQQATIRHNRARGTHTVVNMAAIISEMVQGGEPIQKIMYFMGMERDEVIRLANKTGIPKSKLIEESDWSPSWTPK